MRVTWGLLFLVLLLSMPSVTALGLSYEYLEDKTLELGPGENYFFKLIFQNDEDEDVRIKVTLNSDIATLAGDVEITIPEQTYDSFVYFDIKVPKDAAPGDTFPISYEVLPIKDGEGQVPFSVKYSRGFSVLVIDKVVPDIQTPSDMNLVARNKIPFGGIGVTLVLLVVIAALIVLIWRRSELLTGHFTPKQAPVAPMPKPPKPHHLKETAKAKLHNAEKTAEVLAVKAASELSKAAHEAAEYAHHMKEEHDKKKHEKEHKKEQHAHKSHAHKKHEPHKPKSHFTLDQLSQNQAPSEKQFILTDGTSFRNLHGLYRAVQAMDAATFHIYINKEKNDFQLWIADALKLPHVAARVGLVSSKKEVLRALEES